MGWSEELFWSTTPAELNQAAREYGKVKQEEAELAKSAAYWTAALARAKDIPSYDHWMNPPKPARVLEGEEAAQRQQEHDELEARMRAWQQQEGDSDG